MGKAGVGARKSFDELFVPIQNFIGGSVSRDGGSKSSFEMILGEVGGLKCLLKGLESELDLVLIILGRVLIGEKNWLVVTGCSRRKSADVEVDQGFESMDFGEFILSV